MTRRPPITNRVRFYRLLADGMTQAELGEKVGVMMNRSGREKGRSPLPRR